MARPGEPRAAFPSTLPHPRRLSDGAARLVPAPGAIAGRNSRRPRASPHARAVLPFALFLCRTVRHANQSRGRRENPWRATGKRRLPMPLPRRGAREGQGRRSPLFDHRRWRPRAALHLSRRMRPARHSRRDRQARLAPGAALRVWAKFIFRARNAKDHQRARPRSLARRAGRRRHSRRNLSSRARLRRAAARHDPVFASLSL